MKIVHLEATDIHGYLPVNIKFDETLTFITGVNGSGKTTALKLLLGLLTPLVESLAAIEFKHAKATIINDNSTFTISATKPDGGLSMASSASTATLTLSAAELQILRDARTHDAKWSPVHEKIKSNSLFKFIRSLATPLFLGLNRRQSETDLLLAELEHIS